MDEFSWEVELSMYSVQFEDDFVAQVTLMKIVKEKIETGSTRSF